jgi:6-pyruvoyltetrahydropterin/6-carboxytetrahydropterin synthase
MKAKITKTFTFEAAHSLPNLPAGHKCRRPHGHSYTVRLECIGEVNEDIGWVRDYAEFDPFMDEMLLNKLDHQDLNALFDRTPGFKALPTTSEYLALYILQRAPKWVTAVAISETARTWVEVRREWLPEH